MLSKIIIIPIYKEIPNEVERTSFCNTINVLLKHKISLVTYKELNLSYYTHLLDINEVTYQVDFFDKSYFEDLLSYNKLLLSEAFYQNYSNFDFMLITQLDVYIFRDELNFWCNKGYDYIGAPWYDRFRIKHQDGELKKVGNGGFSLRKIKSFIAVFRYIEKKNKIISLFNFWNQFELFESHKFSIEEVTKRLRGIENNLRYYMNSTKQEDVVWSLIVPEAIKSFKVAPVNDAIKFSFEADPSYLYQRNNNQLPFGCHAWHKNQYDEFWSKFISVKK